MKKDIYFLENINQEEENTEENKDSTTTENISN